jgi:hypothetical protein
MAPVGREVRVAKYIFVIRVADSPVEYLYEAKAMTFAGARREVQMIPHLTKYRLFSEEKPR